MDAYWKSGQLFVFSSYDREVHLSRFRDTSYKYALLYVRSVAPSSPTAKAAAVDTIATALRLPSIFDFDPLFKLEAVVAVKDHELFSLLQIFLNEGLTEFIAWEKTHQGVLEKYSSCNSLACALALILTPVFLHRFG
jgi:hypothetical protein